MNYQWTAADADADVVDAVDAVDDDVEEVEEYKSLDDENLVWKKAEIKEDNADY